MKNVTGLALLLSLIITGCASNVQYKINDYQYVDVQVTWEEARHLAESAGGYLAVFETQGELSYVQSEIVANRTAWVGLTDSKKEGEWVWLNGVKYDPINQDVLERGCDLDSRDYAHIRLSGGLKARHNTGISPRCAKGSEFVHGYVIERENQ